MIQVEQVRGKCHLIFESGNHVLSLPMEKVEAESWKLLFEEQLENGVPFESLYRQAEIVFQINTHVLQPA